jgi:hypothetical protein
MTGYWDGSFSCRECATSPNGLAILDGNQIRAGAIYQLDYESEE